MSRPRPVDFSIGIGQALVCLALALLVALGCYVASLLLDARLAKRTLEVREIAEDLMHEAERGA